MGDINQSNYNMSRYKDLCKYYCPKCQEEFEWQSELFNHKCKQEVKNDKTTNSN